MPIGTGKFGVDQATGQVQQYVPPTVVNIGTATVPAPAIMPAGQEGPLAKPDGPTPGKAS
jgi:hypothetical protein